jgi:hypothetical protein
MRSWHRGLPEATEFSVFPPSGRVREWSADKEATQARLYHAFPDLKFSIVDMSLGDRPRVIPILGEAGEGGRGLYAGPPSRERMREIEDQLAKIDFSTRPEQAFSPA